jgi:predicted glutamine amidotransferase
MCGIVGFFGKPAPEHRKAFEHLLHIDMIRGKDSTGIAAIGKKRVDMAKGCVSPTGLLNSDAYKRIGHDKKFGYIGHNRFATVGNVTAENAHPFKIGRITGVHNGTVPLYEIPKELHKGETDSETVINVIDKKGIEYAWEKMPGATCLIWWDAQYKTLNIIRNIGRPMNIVTLENDEGIFFASEEWMIDGVLARMNIKTKQDNWVPKVEYLYTFKYKNGKVSYEKKELQPWKWVAPPGYNARREAAYSAYLGYGQSVVPFVMGPANRNTSSTTTATTLSGNSQAKGFDMFTRRSVPGDREWDRLQGVTKEELADYYLDGCIYCGSAMEHETVLILDKIACEAVCEGCQITAGLNGMDVKVMRPS